MIMRKGEERENGINKVEMTLNRINVYLQRTSNTNIKTLEQLHMAFRVVTMQSSVFKDTTASHQEKFNQHFGRIYIPPKHPFTFTRLQDIISHKTELFNNDILCW
jgi:hypothetical protein